MNRHGEKSAENDFLPVSQKHMRAGHRNRHDMACPVAIALRGDIGEAISRCEEGKLARSAGTPRRHEDESL